MANALYQSFERFLGRGSASVTIPPMDGALKPNSRLETAESLAPVPAPDNLIASGDDILFSSNGRLLRLTPEAGSLPAPVAEFDKAILSLAGAPGGGIAIALDQEGVLIRGGRHDGKRFAAANGVKLGCVVALAFAGDDTLVVCNGSSVNPAADWQRDLLEMENGGSVWSLDLATEKATLLADRLHFPYGLHILDGGQEALVSESWKSRVVRIGLTQRREPQVVLSGLPGYPARLSPRAAGGAWLAVFAPRSQLIEFVLREKTYRRAMVAEVEPAFWVAPALASGKSFSEPMQGGALKQMGILKPWAPTRSYGLVVELDDSFEPQASFHSRAGGERHGITSALQVADRLILASKGGNELLSLDLAQQDA